MLLSLKHPSVMRNHDSPWNSVNQTKTQFSSVLQWIKQWINAQVSFSESMIHRWIDGEFINGTMKQWRDGWSLNIVFLFIKDVLLSNGPVNQGSYHHWNPDFWDGPSSANAPWIAFPILTSRRSEANHVFFSSICDFLVESSDWKCLLILNPRRSAGRSSTYCRFCAKYDCWLVKRGGGWQLP